MKPVYITMTRRQRKLQWSGGIAALQAPKNSECKNALKISRLDFLESRWHWLSSSGQTSNAEYYQSMLVQLKYIWKEKRSGKVTKGSCSCTTISPAHRSLLTQKKLFYLGFQCVDHAPYLYSSDLAPSDIQLLHGLKTQLKVAIFLPTRRQFLPWRPGWMDNVVNFF